MPLDPTIANPATIKFADPIESYKNALSAQYLQEEIQKMKDARADSDATNLAMKEYANPKYTTDEQRQNATVNALAQNNRGQLIPGFQSKWAEVAKAKAAGEKDSADAVKALVEGRGKEMDNMAKMLQGVSALDPQSAQVQMFHYYKNFANNQTLKPWIEQVYGSTDNYLRDKVGGLYRAAQNPQSLQQIIDEEAMGVKNTQDLIQKHNELKQQASKMSTHVVDRGGMGQTVVQTPDYGQPGMSVLGTFSSTSKAPQVNIDNRAVGKFEDKMMEQAATSYEKMRGSAANARRLYDSAQQIIDLVKSGKAYTGAGAGAKMSAANILTALGIDGWKDEATASQLLDKFLNANIFNQVGQFKNEEGVPMNRLTNLDLMLTKDATAKQSMTPEAIIGVMQQAQELARRAVLNHNDRYTEMMGTPELAKGMRMSGAHSFPLLPGTRVPTADAITHLRKGDVRPETFDEIYGPGAAARATRGGTSTGGAPFNGLIPPNSGAGTYSFTPSVERWRPLVTKWARGSGVDPDLVLHIMSKESGGDANVIGRNSDGSTDTGLMQVNSIHGLNPKALLDPEFNIRQGIGILAGSLKAHKGDLRAGIKGYNGSGPAADAYAADILSRYKGNGR